MSPSNVRQGLILVHACRKRPRFAEKGFVTIHGKLISAIECVYHLDATSSSFAGKGDGVLGNVAQLQPPRFKFYS